ncbi:twitchin-like [Acyrthosiphon pisum]|uniref:Fibronectin type-III domain-containing protein n=1 Tax=Acyrthosiphon pisum TaxID=7029 RepID=A0A8R2H9K3_ACYPI|nr:twitchin-like [Acyrthosiphon pisum]|eukprot:XP_003247789.1 PREDICTED: twitchin-like [Acyrthosiphon pisum]
MLLFIIILVFLSDTRGPLGLLEVIDYDENMVELKWDASWRISNNSPTCVKELFLITEGHQYEFRVRAVNKAGPGEASETTLLHLAMLKNLAPHIDRNTLSKIKV